MNVAAITDVLEELAPRRYAAPWDNVGLLIGARDARVERIVLTIDLTETVLDEAVSLGAQMVIAYHPPIFQPFKTLTDDTVKQRIVLRAAQAGIAVHSPHTSIDAAPGGVNDWLADGLGGGDRRALHAHEELPPTEENKIITFCPADAAEQIRNGLASIGAGRIGDYAMCSFELPGTGTFFAGEGATPTVGQRQQLERVDEVRLEMVCPSQSLGLAVMALRQFHPYEEPPIEIHPLRARPRRDVGQGRRVTLDRPIVLRTLVDRIKSRLSVKQVRVAVGQAAPDKCSVIGLCAGAGGSLLDEAIEQGCHVFFTGEMRHHDVIDAQARGCTIILAGHTNTERGYLPVLAERLGERLPELDVQIAGRDTDPLRVM